MDRVLEYRVPVRNKLRATALARIAEGLSIRELPVLERAIPNVIRDAELRDSSIILATLQIVR